MSKRKAQKPIYLDDPLEEDENGEKNKIGELCEDMFVYNGVKYTVITDDTENVWIKAIEVGTLLKYTNTRKAIRDHVRDEDKIDYATLKNRRNETFPPLKSIDDSPIVSCVVPFVYELN